MAHLALVPPPGAEPPPAPPRRRGHAPALSVTADEARHFRAAVRGLVKTRYGTLRKLAAALEIDPGIRTRRRAPHPGLVLAVWRETGVPVETLLHGKPVAVSSSAPTPKEGGA